MGNLTIFTQMHKKVTTRFRDFPCQLYFSRFSLAFQSAGDPVKYDNTPSPEMEVDAIFLKMFKVPTLFTVCQSTHVKY